ncbi:sigma-70 family RNA polymerase sigma factor [Bremerella sp. JC817]|uniref:RNA polymerase sigma factor n=1 Tax=Bremerella sp. JC817 TaxID=3231756 RepID=UPI0034595FA2
MGAAEIELGHTTDLQNELRRLSEGCPESRRTIVELCCQRLRTMARRMLKSYGHVQRWSDTDDVLQASLLRLHRALASVQPESVRKFYGLAATQIRRELIDLARSHYGPQGIGAKHDSDGGKASERCEDPFEPESLAAWTEFHEAVEALPEAEKEVVSLLWYDGLNQSEAARVLGISLATLKRRWVSARLLLKEQLAGGLDLD